MLTNSQIYELNEVLIKDNKYVDHISYINQFVGRGNTNTYNMKRTEGVSVYPLKNYKNKKIFLSNIKRAFNGTYYVAIAAIVEDVVYLIHEYLTSDGWVKCVSRHPLGTYFIMEDCIAYDTLWYFEITALSKNKNWRKTYKRPSFPDGDDYKDMLPVKAEQ